MVLSFYLLIDMLVMQIASFVCHQSVLVGHRLTGQQRNVCLRPRAATALLRNADLGCAGWLIPVNLYPREINANGGGLLVAPMNAPHLQLGQGEICCARDKMF